MQKKTYIESYHHEISELEKGREYPKVSREHERPHTKNLESNWCQTSQY